MRVSQGVKDPPPTYNRQSRKFFCLLYTSSLNCYVHKAKGKNIILCSLWTVLTQLGDVSLIFKGIQIRQNMQIKCWKRFIERYANFMLKASIKKDVKLYQESELNFFPVRKTYKKQFIKYISSITS